jgi:hypothetical protein
MRLRVDLVDSHGRWKAVANQYRSFATQCYAERRRSCCPSNRSPSNRSTGSRRRTVLRVTAPFPATPPKTRACALCARSTTTSAYTTSTPCESQHPSHAPPPNRVLVGCIGCSGVVASASATLEARVSTAAQPRALTARACGATRWRTQRDGGVLPQRGADPGAGGLRPHHHRAQAAPRAGHRQGARRAQAEAPRREPRGG